MKTLFKKIRTRLLTVLCLRGIKKHGTSIHVNKRSAFTKETQIGSNCHFNGMTITGNGLVTIGDNLHSGKGVSIITSFHNYDQGNALPYDDSLISKDVRIGDNVWLGQDIIILGGISIGEGAIIQAGSVVCSSIPPLAIAGGHPAKPFKYRNKEHYYLLKEQEKFF